MQKSTIYAVFILFLLLVPSVALGHLPASGDVDGAVTLVGGYEIYQTGSVSYLRNVLSGVVVASGDANAVFRTAFGYLSSGGNLTVKRGTYVGTTSFYMNRCNNVNVLFEDGAVLTIADGVNQSVLFLRESSNNVFTNLYIDGNKAGQKVPLPREAINGITVSTGSNNVFQDSTITNCRRSGIEIFGDSVVAPARGNIIRNCLITYCGWNGVTVGSGPSVVNTMVLNNEVAHVSDVGIATYGDATLIDGNYVHDIDGMDGSPKYAGAVRLNNSHWGIAQEGGTGPIITNNVVENCDGIGICFDVGKSAIIRLNEVTNCGIGISGANDGYNVISENVIRDWHLDRLGISCGIGVYFGVGTNVSFNALISTSGVEARAIVVYESSGCYVGNNTIVTDLAVPSWNSAGIHLIGARDAVVVGNNIQATRPIVGSATVSINNQVQTR